MSTPDTLAPVSVQENVISASLNASMIFNFLMGVYTMVYAGTMYLCASKMVVSVNRRILLWSISALYFVCFTEFIIQWYTLDLEIVTNGSTRESIFISIVDGGSRWIRVFMDFLRYSCLMLSDGLLIWRCYHVWGESFRVILAPLLLMTMQFCLLIVGTTLDGLSSYETGSTTPKLSNDISTAFIFVSLGATAITMFLIGYRIYPVSGTDGPRSFTRLFNRIVALTTNSAAVYSLALLVEAVVKVIPLIKHDSSLEEAEYYSQAVLSIVTGMAPTVLVTRIALTNSGRAVASTATHISGLQFGSQPGSDHTSRDGIGGEVTASIYAGDVVSKQTTGVKRARSMEEDGGSQV